MVLPNATILGVKSKMSRRTDLIPLLVSCLIIFIIFRADYGCQIVSGSSEGFSLRGPTHCLSVGSGYDSKFLFSLRSSGYIGRVDLEVNAPSGIDVELRSPVYLNSTEIVVYCPITVRANSKASFGNQSITIIARGDSYLDSISICIIVSGFATLTIQTSPSDIPVDFLLDNTRHHSEARPFILLTRSGKHTLELLTISPKIGSAQFSMVGVEFSSSEESTVRHENLTGPLSLNFTSDCYVTFVFREEQLSPTHTHELGGAARLEQLFVPVIITMIILAAVLLYKDKRMSRYYSDHICKLIEYKYC